MDFQVEGGDAGFVGEEVDGCGVVEWGAANGGAELSCVLEEFCCFC